MSRSMVLATIASMAHGCTHFILGTPEGDVLGRSMELGGVQPAEVDAPMPWDIVKVPAGREFKPSESDSCKGQAVAGWVGKYSYVGVGYETSDYRVTDGMNMEGLSIGEQTLRMTQYQVPAAGKPAVCWQDMTTWLLSTCSDVPCVLNTLNSTNVVALPGFSSHGFQHWSVSDKFKNNIVIEYLKGELRIHNNTVKVMTNDPPFEWQILNLNQGVMLDTKWSNPAHIQVQTPEFGAIPNQISHGLNLVGLPGDFSPPGRFTRAFYLKQFAERNTPPSNIGEGVDLATGLLNSVHIPKGVVAHKGGPGNDGTWDFTQFASLKIPGQQQYYLRTYNNMQWRKIDLKKTDWKNAFTIPLYNYENGVKDITRDLL